MKVLRSASLLADNLIEPGKRHAEADGEGGLRDAQGLQELFPQHLARMTGGIFVGSRRRTSGLMEFGRLGVRDFDFVGITSLPAETDSVLFIDTNSVLTATISFQPLQPIAWWHCEFPKISDPIELRQLTVSPLR